MPGSFLPSRNSRLAPPPVEMWPNCVSSNPRMRTAAAESPPPTTDSPETSVRACAIARVPFANFSISNTPIGPFQNTVLASAISLAKLIADSGPMSRPSPLAPNAVFSISSAFVTSISASAPNLLATTMSLGRITSTPSCSALVKYSRQTSIWSFSSRLEATLKPLAARNVNSIPPPISSLSTVGSRWSITASLSLTFEPPRTTT